jgi:hypothetical protein
VLNTVSALDDEMRIKPMVCRERLYYYGRLLITVDWHGASCGSFQSLLLICTEAMFSPSASDIISHPTRSELVCCIVL